VEEEEEKEQLHPRDIFPVLVEVLLVLLLDQMLDLWHLQVHWMMMMLFQVLLLLLILIVVVLVLVQEVDQRNCTRPNYE